MSYSPFRHIPSVFLKTRPVHLTLFLTRRCNLRCPFCFYVSSDDEYPDSSDELTLQEIDKISRSVGSLLWLAFSGGEIFLRDDIAEITKLFYKHNRPSIILFPTNGLMTGLIRKKIEEVLTSCPESTIVVKLSLDGPEDTHDLIRGKAGSFKKVIETYKSLGELTGRYDNFELGVNTVFCSSNQDHIEETIEFVKGMDKIKTHTVSLIRGDVSDSSLKDVDIEKYNRVIERMADDLREKRAQTYSFGGAKLKAAQDIVQRRLIYETERKKKQIIPCYAGRLNIVITESGDVYPCESFDMKMGNLKEFGYDVSNLLKSSNALKVISSIRNNKCFCTHECYMMTNILFNPGNYPELIKEYLRLIRN